LLQEGKPRADLTDMHGLREVKRGKGIGKGEKKVES
jgi:hypothetical protein